MSARARRPSAGHVRLVVGLIVAVVVFLDGVDVSGLPDAVRDGVPDDVLRELEEQLPEGIEGIQGRV